MNKKIILSSVLGASLLLASCGEKQLWTFEEELKAEQKSYEANINKFIADNKEFSEWKIKQNSDIIFSASNDKNFNSNVKMNLKADAVIEKENILADLDFKADLALNVDKDSNQRELQPLKWWDISWKINLKSGFDGKNLYINLKDIDFSGKWTPDIENQFKSFKTQFDILLKPYAGRWYFYDLSTLPDFKNWMAELKKVVSMNQKVHEMYKDLLTSIVTADIYTKGEKTTFEWKEAYKFAIDEAKLKTSIVSISKKITEKYEDALVLNWLKKEEIKSFSESIEKDLANKKLLKSSELYLTRSSDGGANIIIKNIETYLDDNDTLNISWKILEKNLKLSFDIAKKALLDLNFSWAKNGFIFDWNIKTIESENELSGTGKVEPKMAELLKFTWKLDSSKSWKTLLQNYTFNASFAKKENNEEIVNWLNFSFDAKSKIEKDDSLKITKESITENAKEVFSINDLLKTLPFPIGWAHMNTNLNIEDPESEITELEVTGTGAPFSDAIEEEL